MTLGRGKVARKTRKREEMLTQVDRELQYDYLSRERAFPIWAVVTASGTLFSLVKLGSFNHENSQIPAVTLWMLRYGRDTLFIEWAHEQVRLWPQGICHSENKGLVSGRRMGRKCGWDNPGSQLLVKGNRCRVWKRNAQFFVALPLDVILPGRKGTDVSSATPECSRGLQLFWAWNRKIPICTWMQPLSWHLPQVRLVHLESGLPVFKKWDVLYI